MRQVAGVAVCLLELACGPSFAVDASAESDASDASDPSDSSNSSESSGGDAVTEPPPMSCSALPPLGFDPFTEQQSCGMYLGEVAAPTLAVRIVNRTNRPLVLASVTGGPNSAPRHFDVQGAMGDRGFVARPDACIENWDGCAAWAESPPPPCDLIGITHPSIVLAPGGWFEELWSAWVLAIVTLPGECSSTNEAQACSAAIGVGPGTWRLTASAGVLTDASDCCDPDARGSCEAPADVCAVEPTLGVVAFHDGTCDSVEIAFVN